MVARKLLKFGEFTRPKKYKGAMQLKAGAPVKIISIDEEFTPGLDDHGAPKKLALKYKLTNPQDRLRAKIQIFDKSEQASDNKDPLLVEDLSPERSSSGEHDNWSWDGTLNQDPVKGQPIAYKKDEKYTLKVSLFYRDSEVGSDQKELKIGGPRFLSVANRGIPDNSEEGVQPGKASSVDKVRPRLVAVQATGFPDKLEGEPTLGAARPVVASDRVFQAISVAGLADSSEKPVEAGVSKPVKKSPLVFCGSLLTGLTDSEEPGGKLGVARLPKWGSLVEARWSEPKVRPDQEVTLSVKADENVDDGSAVLFEIFLLKDGDREKVEHPELKATLSGDEAKLTWKAQFTELPVPEAAPNVSRGEGATSGATAGQAGKEPARDFRDIPMPKYVFEASCGRHEGADSGELTVADFLDCQVQHSYDDGQPDDDAPMAGVSFKVVRKEGWEAVAQTDKEGRIKLDPVPPGEYELFPIRPKLLTASPAASPAPEQKAKATRSPMVTSPGPEGSPPLGKFSNIRWSKTKARPGEKVKLSFEADDKVPPDTEVSITIMEEDRGSEDDKVPGGELKCVVKDGKGEVEWEVVYMEDTDDTLSSQEIAWKEKGFEQFSLPEYRADLEADDCEGASSGLMTIADVVEGALTFEDGAPVSGMKIRLAFKGGSMETTTDDKGAYCLEDVPPGEYNLEIVPEDR